MTQRYCKKLRADGKITSVGYASPRAVFTKEQGGSVVIYIFTVAEIFHGVTPPDI